MRLRAVQAPAVTRLSQDDWLAMASRSPDFSYRQTWAYGTAAAARVRSQAEFVALGDARVPIGLACVRVRAVKFAPLGIAFVDYGPLCRLGVETPTADALRDSLRALLSEYALRRSLVVRVNPPVSADPETRRIQQDVFADLGFVASARAPHRTILLDVRPSLDVLRRGLHQKWRNCLSRSEREPVAVLAVGLERWDEFAALFQEMVTRKGFPVAMGPTFFRDVFSGARPQEDFRLHVALEGGAMIGAHLGAYVGDTATYLLGVTSPRGRQTFVSYALQWAAICHARLAGCAWYDLGGIDPEANPDGYLFKKRMGGVEAAEIGPFDWCANPVVGRLIQTVDRIRQWRAR